MNKKNKELIKRYPFLQVRNVMTGELDKTYDQTYLDWMPDGWRVAFGDQMIQELSEALGEHAKDFRILDIKEKFGGLRFYCNGATNEAYKVIEKYSRLSYWICIECGKDATLISKGYISPFCDQCAKDKNDKLEDFMKVDFVPIKEYYKGEEEE